MTSKNTGLTESITSKNQEFSHLKSEENIHFFEKLIDQTETRAYSAALRLTHDKDEADDLVQETYIKAWKNFGRYIKEKPFINWILKMMQRLYIDKKRGSRFSDRTESTCRCISTKTGLPQEMEIADTCPTPEEEVVRREFEKEVITLLFKIPFVYLNTILMCDIKGMSYQEIADKQHASMGTVRSRIHRGRKLLRKMIQEKGIQPTFYARRRAV